MRHADRLRLLTDHDDIAQVPRRYAGDFDTGDWASVRSRFTDDATIEGALGTRTATESLRHSELASRACVAMSHVIGNQTVEVDGDLGYVESSVVAYNWMVEPAGTAHPANSLVGARYQDNVVRQGDRWLIVHRRIRRDWSIGEEPT